MRKEPGEPRHDSRPEPLPQILAEQFARGSILATATLVQSRDTSDIYRCFTRPESLSGIPDVQLRVDYRRFHEHSILQDSFDQVRFEYVSGQNEDPFAQMHLDCITPTDFRLVHRYVAPELRTRQGVGTRLLQQTEDWLAQVANASGRDVFVGLQTGQLDVIQWIQKLGYTVQEYQQKELDHVLGHLDEYVLDNVPESEGRRVTNRPNYIFPADATVHDINTAVRFTFVKTIPSSTKSKT